MSNVEDLVYRNAVPRPELEEKEGIYEGLKLKPKSSIN